MILISLLGVYDSSIFPILFEYKDEVKKHIFIHDDSKYETNRIKDVLQAQEKFKEFYSLNYDCYSIKIDEDSYSSINSCFEEIIKLSKGNFKKYIF